MNTFANTYTATEDQTYFTAKAQEQKFESLYQFEEVHSPSTDYTDDLQSQVCESHDLMTQLRKEEFSSDCFLNFSSRFISEVSAFEPLVEDMPQFFLESNDEAEFKIFNKELKIDFGTPITKTPSRKVSSDETNEVCEEEASVELKGWNEKKDKTLKNLASKCKYDWKKIAKKFNTNENTDFTPLELKQKYKDLNKVSIPLRVKFTHQEDLMIAKYFDVYGCDWVQIATHFTDRTAIMLKNRYYSHIRKRNLLVTMLDELKDGSVENTTEEGESQENNEVAQENTENQESSLTYFTMPQFNSFYFELENSLATELFERITESDM